jgi:hypothetical protein
MRHKPLRLYVVVTRHERGSLHEVKVEAEDAFVAHQRVKELFPGERVVRIAPAPHWDDAEDG